MTDFSKPPTVVISPLAAYITRSGTLPISNNGHYDHWEKYQTKRLNGLFKEEKIRKHLKRERLKRPISHIRSKTLIDVSRLASLKPNTGRFSFKTNTFFDSMLSNRRLSFDEFDKISDASENISSLRGSKTPLPSIEVTPRDVETKEELPFEICEELSIKRIQINKMVNHLDLSDKFLDNIWNDRKLNIYICSSNKDMKVERIHLIEHVWPMLRQMSYEHNVELVIHDLHTYNEVLLLHGEGNWKNLIRHTLQDIIHDRNDNIKTIIMIGNQFDEYNLPEILMKEQFNIIEKAMENDLVRISRIYLKMNDLKMTQTRVKQQYFVRRESTFDSISTEKSQTEQDEETVKTANLKIDSINRQLTELKQELDKLLYITDIKLLRKMYSYQEHDVDSTVFTLLPEKSIIPNYESNDPVQRIRNLEKWENYKKQINYILNNYLFSTKCHGMTTFNVELEQMSELISQDKCLLLTRTFTHIKPDENVSCIKETLFQQIPDKHQLRFELDTPEASFVNAKKFREHETYLNEICIELRKLLQENIHKTIEHRNQLEKTTLSQLAQTTINYSDLNALIKELKIQKQFLKKILSNNNYHLENMDNALESLVSAQINSNNNLVACGASMTGKTGVIARFIDNYTSQLSSIDSIVFIYRFIGLSWQSDNNRLLLRSICAQLIYMTQCSLDLPQNYIKLKNVFYYLSTIIQVPIVICLDGVENLENTINGSVLDWLLSFSPNIQWLVSVTPTSNEYKILTKFPQDQITIVEIADLDNSAIDKLIDDFIKSNNLQLQAAQLEDIIAHCYSNRTIGYVLSTFNIIGFWSGNMSLPRLGNKIEQNFVYFLAKLEDLFGEVLIKRFIGLLTSMSSRGGSFNEFIDVLTVDSQFMNFIHSQYKTEVVRCEYSLVIHLLIKIQSYTMQFTGYNGFQSITWRNSLMRKASSDRYLNAKEKNSFHQTISLYYINESSNISIYNKYAENDAFFPILNKTIIKQNLRFERTHKFNLRKILVLPNQLLSLQNSKLLKTLCIFNIHWLQTILSTYKYDGLLELLKLIIHTEPEDVEYLLLLETIQLIDPNIVNNDPMQITSQLSGRLSSILQADTKNKDGRKLMHLTQLLHQMKNNSWSHCFVVSKVCMTSPDANNCGNIFESSAKITGFTVNSNCSLLYIAMDIAVLYVWNVQKNSIVGMLNGIGNNVTKIVLNNDFTKVVLSDTQHLELWNLNTFSLERRLHVKFDPYLLIQSEDKTLLSTLFYGTCFLTTLSFDNFEILNHYQVDLDTSINNQGKILAHHTCKGFKALTAVEDDNKAFLIDIKSGERFSKILKCRDEGSAIVFLNMSNNYFILCIKSLAPDNLKSNIFYVETFNIETFQNLRKITGCFLDNIMDFSINSIGSHAITSNINYLTNSTDLSVWNLETEEHKHCPTLPGISPLVITKEFSLIFMLVNDDQKIIKLNIQSSLQTTKLKIVKNQNYTLEKFELNSNYIMNRSDDNKIVRLYNMTKNKYKGRMVLSINEMANENDHFYLFKDKLIILTDRRFSQIASDCRDVYQCAKIFDLTQHKFISNINQLVIYPARRNEFTLLKEDVILGLSDNRSHLIIWSITTGQIQNRIRPNPEMLMMLGSNSFNSDSRLSIAASPSKSAGGFDRSIHELVIDNILISANNSILVASYFSWFILVFSLNEFKHLSTIVGECSVLHLNAAALSNCGSYLIQNNFNELEQRINLTVWQTRTAEIENKLTLNNYIQTVAIDNTNKLAVFIEENIGLVIWNFTEENQCITKHFAGYFEIPKTNLQLNSEIKFSSNNKLILINTGIACYIWSLNYENLACTKLSSIQPDQIINSATICCNDTLLIFTLKGSDEIFSVKIYNDKNCYRKTNHHKNNKCDYLEVEHYPHSSDESDKEI